MSTTASHHDLHATQRELTRRCRELSIPTWQLQEDGTCKELPTGWGPADHWLQTPLLRQWIGAVVDAAPVSMRGGFVTVFPGCWIVPLTSSRRPRVTVAAMLLAYEAIETEHFQRVCDSGRLDGQICRTALAPIARWTRPDCERLTSVLRWMHADLEQAGEQLESITEFSKQLASAFEQLTLLYDLSRSINRIDEPDRFIDLACCRMQEVLDFPWVVIGLDDLDVTRGMHDGTPIISGRLPFGMRRLTDELRALTLAEHRHTVLLAKGEHPIADLAGTDVLAAPILAKERQVGVILAGGRACVQHDVGTIDFNMLRATAEYLGSFVHSFSALQEQRSIFLGTIRAITYTIEAKDRYTRGHSERVAHLAAQLALAHGMDQGEVSRLRLAGLLHDVGKIGVSETVLRKPDRLTNEEFEAIKRHPVIGYTILRDIAPLHDILPGVLHHHEKWNGTGYPQGLSGTGIPLIARILAVADTFDAMCSERSYRSARPRKKVIEDLRGMAGSQLDPELTETFLTLDLSAYDLMIARHLAIDGSRDSNEAA